MLGRLLDPFPFTPVSEVETRMRSPGSASAGPVGMTGSNDSNDTTVPVASARLNRDE